MESGASRTFLNNFQGFALNKERAVEVWDQAAKHARIGALARRAKWLQMLENTG